MTKILAVASMSLLLAAAPPPERPDPTLTPGHVDPKLTAATLCAPTFRTGAVRDVEASTKKQVFARYGLDPKSDRFEIDHLISLELGGMNDVTNLWPQSYTTQPLNATVKDGLENRLHHLVCTQGTDHIALAVAQQAISEDWPAAYRKYLCSAKGVTLTALQVKACRAFR